MYQLARVVLVVLILPAALPLLLAIYICVIVFSGKPAFYRAQRVGKHRIYFDLFKFRTMKPNSETGGPITGPDDLRITKIGRFLRNTKLDELPQLFNIAMGDMAFIGPRPEAPEIVDKFYDLNMLKILEVRPGLTGAGTLYYLKNFKSQIDPNAPEASYVENMLRPRLEADLDYQDRRTMFTDLKIAMQTIFILISRLFSKIYRE